MKDEQLRKRPVRTADIELPEPYAGWQATVRTNIPMGTYNALVGGTWEEKLRALRDAIIEWNFPDDEGVVIPLELPEMKKRLGFSEVKLTIQAIDQAIADFLAGLNTPA